MNSKPKVLHIISGLGRGGAETLLTNLLASFKNQSKFEHIVISLAPGNDFLEEHRLLNIQVYYINVKNLLLLPWYLYKLKKRIKKTGPFLIHGWMYHGNIAAYFGSSRQTVFFSIHNALNALTLEKKLTKWVLKYGARLSKRVRSTIYCSEVSKDQHLALGYNRKNIVVIPNGVRTNIFVPDNEAAVRLRQELGVPGLSIIAGQVARFHPIKNQLGLLNSITSVIKTLPQFKLLLIGPDCNESNQKLVSAIDRLGLRNSVYLLGQKNQIERIISGLDFLISPSLSEAFPLSLVEAMSCGVPCVATGVGDSNHILGDTGFIVNPGNTGELSSAILEMAELPELKRKELGGRARLRVLEYFSFESMQKKYEDMYLLNFQKSDNSYYNKL